MRDPRGLHQARREKEVSGNARRKVKMVEFSDDSRYHISKRIAIVKDGIAL